MYNGQFITNRIIFFPFHFYGPSLKCFHTRSRLPAASWHNKYHKFAQTSIYPTECTVNKSELPARRLRIHVHVCICPWFACEHYGPRLEFQLSVESFVPLFVFLYNYLRVNNHSPHTHTHTRVTHSQLMTASTQRESELKAQLLSVQEAVQRQLTWVSSELEETRVQLEQQEREAGSQRAELEGRVAMVTRQLESEREDWTKSESQLKTVCCTWCRNYWHQAHST